MLRLSSFLIGGGGVVIYASAVTKDAKKFHETYAGLSEKIRVSREEAEWVETIAQGWSDLDGFMTEEQVLKSLHQQQPPLPVVLGCPYTPDTAPKKLGLSHDFSDHDSSSGGEHPIAILHDVQVYEHRKDERIARTFGLHGGTGVHPYVETNIAPASEYLCGGKLEVLQEKFPRRDGLDEYRLTPQELLTQHFSKHDAVFVFQLRNPVHNGHALLMQETYKSLKQKGFKSPALWLNPLGGWTKDDDVPLDVRMKQHHAVIGGGIFGDVPVILSIFPSPMAYAGPREVQWHALARQRAGATHYIVGRDPAGLKVGGADLYSPWHGQMMLKMNPRITVELVPFQFASYDKTSGKMAFFDPKRKDDFVSISGTKMRKMAAEDETPPDGFMEPGGWKVLVHYYSTLKKDGVWKGYGAAAEKVEL